MLEQAASAGFYDGQFGCEKALPFFLCCLRAQVAFSRWSGQALRASQRSPAAVTSSSSSPVRLT
jgi:hypothetical protein